MEAGAERPPATDSGAHTVADLLRRSRFEVLPLDGIEQEVRANLDFETNLTAEVLVRAIAKHTGVDMAAVNEMVRAEIERTEQQLATRP